MTLKDTKYLAMASAVKMNNFALTTTCSIVFRLRGSFVFITYAFQNAQEFNIISKE